MKKSTQTRIKLFGGKTSQNAKKILALLLGVVMLFGLLPGLLGAVPDKGEEDFIGTDYKRGGEATKSSYLFEVTNAWAGLNEALCGGYGSNGGVTFTVFGKSVTLRNMWVDTGGGEGYPADYLIEGGGGSPIGTAWWMLDWCGEKPDPGLGAARNEWEFGGYPTEYKIAGLKPLIELLAENDTVDIETVTFTLKETPGVDHSEFANADGLKTALNANVTTSADFTWDWDDDDLIAVCVEDGSIDDTSMSLGEDSAVTIATAANERTGPTGLTITVGRTDDTTDSLYTYPGLGTLVDLMDVNDTFVLDTVTFKKVDENPTASDGEFTTKSNLLTALGAVTATNLDNLNTPNFRWSGEGDVNLLMDDIGVATGTNSPGDAIFTIAGAGSLYTYTGMKTLVEEMKVGDTFELDDVIFEKVSGTPTSSDGEFTNSTDLLVALVDVTATNLNALATPNFRWDGDDLLMNDVGVFADTNNPGAAEFTFTFDVDFNEGGWYSPDRMNTLLSAFEYITGGLDKNDNPVDLWDWYFKDGGRLFAEAWVAGEFSGNLITDNGEPWPPMLPKEADQKLTVSKEILLPTTGAYPWTGPGKSLLVSKETKGQDESNSVLILDFEANQAKELHYSILEFKQDPLGRPEDTIKVVIMNGDPLGIVEADGDWDDGVCVGQNTGLLYIDIEGCEKNSVKIANTVLNGLYTLAEKGAFDAIDQLDGLLGPGGMWDPDEPLKNNVTRFKYDDENNHPEMTVTFHRASEAAQLDLFWPILTGGHDPFEITQKGILGTDYNTSGRFDLVELPFDKDLYLPYGEEPYTKFTIGGYIYDTWVFTSNEWGELSKYIDAEGWDWAFERMIGEDSVAASLGNAVGLLWEDYYEDGEIDDLFDGKYTVVVRGVNGRVWILKFKPAGRGVDYFTINGATSAMTKEPLTSAHTWWNAHVDAMEFIVMDADQLKYDPMAYRSDAKIIFDPPFESPEDDKDEEAALAKMTDVEYFTEAQFNLYKDVYNAQVPMTTSWNSLLIAGVDVKSGYDKFEYGGVIAMKYDGAWYLFKIVEEPVVKGDVGNSLISITLNGKPYDAKNDVADKVYGMGTDSKVYAHYKDHLTTVKLDIVETEVATLTSSGVSWTGFESYYPNGSIITRYIPNNIFSIWGEEIAKYGWFDMLDGQDPLAVKSDKASGTKLVDGDVIAVKAIDDDNLPHWWFFQIEAPGSVTPPPPPPKDPDPTTPPANNGGGGGGGSSKAAPSAPAIAPSKNVTEFVTALYKIALGRDPDKGGLEHWTGQITSGKMTPAVAVKHFLLAEETVAKNLTNAQFVELLYNIFMGRKSDKGGLDNWVGLLVAGMSRETVINHFFTSVEFTAIQAAWK